MTTMTTIMHMTKLLLKKRKLRLGLLPKMHLQANLATLWRLVDLSTLVFAWLESKT